MNKLVLYTTECPRCKILKKKLEQKNLDYSEVSDLDQMLAKGFKSVPVLEVDGKAYSYEDAMNFLNKA